MESNSEILKYIYQEDLYIIDEPEPLQKTIEIEPVQEVTDEEQVIEQINESKPVKYLGSNTKGILILVNDTESEFLNPHDLDFLMKIVESGLKFSKMDVAIVNCVKYPYWQIFDEVHHAYIIAFGSHQTDVLQGQQKYQVFNQEEGTKILLADDLNIVEGDKEKKVQLWKALQRMFDLN